MSSERPRKFLVTLNNPELPEHGSMNHNAIIAILEKKNLEYWAFVDEIGKNGNFHTHVFLMAKNPRRISTIQKAFPHGHIDICRGTAVQIRDYLKKNFESSELVSSSFHESGPLPDEPGQGARTDISRIKSLYEQDLTPLQIAETLDLPWRLEKITRLCDAWRYEEYAHNPRESVQVIFLYGATSTGKSHWARYTYPQQLGYKPSEVFVTVEGDKHLFDAYKDEPYMVIDEVTGKLDLSIYLSLLDRHSYMLPARYSNHVCCARTIVLVSNLSPETLYSDVRVNEIERYYAFVRRFQSVGVKYSQQTEPVFAPVTGLSFPPKPLPAWVQEADSADDADIQQQIIPDL